jgi:hypothetical protein
VSMLKSAIRAASRILGVERDAPEGLPAGLAKQRARAAKAEALDIARGRRRSRMSRAWPIILAGFILDHGRLDAGQRQALRGRILPATRRRRTRLKGDNRTTRGPRTSPTGCWKRRTRAARLANAPWLTSGPLSSSE